MNKKILFFCAVIILIVMLAIGIKYQDKMEIISRKYNKPTKNEKNVESDFLNNIEESQKIAMYNELQYNLYSIATKVFENLNIHFDIEYVKLNIKDYYNGYKQKEYVYEAYTKDYKVTFYERSKDIKIETQNVIERSKKVDRNIAEEVAKNFITKYDFLNEYEFKELLETEDSCYSAIYYTDKRDKNNNFKPTICKVLFEPNKEELINAEYTYENISEDVSKVEISKAIEIAKEEAKKVNYTDFGDNYYVMELEVTPNNFFTRKKDEKEIYGNTDKNAYVVTFYSETKSELVVFVDVQNGEVIGGKRK